MGTRLQATFILGAIGTLVIAGRLVDHFRGRGPRTEVGAPHRVSGIPRRA